jgi:hypothetical protein
MRTNRKQSIVLLVGVACLASSANAQSLFSTSPNLVATNDWAVPGLPGVTFGGSGNFDLPVMDSNGTLLFRARMLNTAGGAVTERALFYGTTYANLTLLAQSGGPAPTLPGIFLQTPTGNGPGGSPRLSASGLSLWGSNLTGTGVLTTNDTALFGGLPSSPTLFVREGDVMPNTTGATITTALNNLSQQPTGIISNGRILFQGTLAGGDVSGTTNNVGWITGSPAALEFAIRKGDSVLGGAVIGALGFISQMNEAGQVLHEETLSTTLGAPPATSANDKAFFVFTPGSGNALIAREGDPAPGTAGATFNNTLNSWAPNTGACSFNSSGNTIFQSDLLNGDVVAGVNDRGVYVGGPGTLSLALRRGDAAPGTDGTFVAANDTSQCINNDGRIAFEAQITGGTSTPADDTGIWTGLPGSLQLIVREGQLAPGTSLGELIGSTMGQQEMFNDQGQVLFRNTLTNAAVGFTSALYAWTPGVGLTLVIRGGDQIEVSPGVFKTVDSFGGVQFNNGDAAGLGLSHTGLVALRLGFTDLSGGIVTLQLPAPPAVTSKCTPGWESVRACPCSNPPSGLDRGCDNKTASGGASISGSGSNSLATPTLTFTTANENPSVGSVLIQGTTLTTGVSFGHGVRCASGVIKRLYIKISSGGSITAPGAGDADIPAESLAKGDPISPGSKRWYQVYYRDSTLLLPGCPIPSNQFNATNAAEVTWNP